jgi:F-type H+-transporting ATPase subunit b
MNINATLLVQALSFAGLIWFAVAFIWPPLTRAIDARQKQIADGLAAAERGKQEFAAAEQTSAEVIAAAHGRAQDIVALSEKRAAEIVEHAKQAGKAESDRMLVTAKADIDQEVARTKEALREQVAALVISGAEKILQREVDAKAHATLLAQLKQQL